MIKVVFFSNIPAPYFVEFLNELGKLCTVHAVFERARASDRNSSWNDINAKNFTYAILNGINIGTEQAISLSAIKEIDRNPDAVFVLGNMMTPTGIVLNIYLRIRKIPFILQSEGGIPKSGKGLKEKFKKWIIKGADFCFSGMKYKNDYFAFYGVSRDNVWHYPFSSIHEKQVCDISYHDNRRIELKKTLNICERIVFLYVGQFIHRKGIDILLNAYGLVENDSTGLYLIGGQENSEYEDIVRRKSIKKVHFLPFMKTEDILNYYRASDCFVMATREDTWGLVVNEALLCGLPVITTKACVAGNELIEDGKNGFLVDSENVEALANAMKQFINSFSDFTELRENCINSVRDYTYENMAKSIFDGLKYYLGRYSEK
jgi:glycosyltransferase involved in cell wall biosynthesis